MWTSSSSSAFLSASLSSSSSSPSPHAASNPRIPKTREEVWKDITFAASDLHHPSARGMILQDFFSKDPLPTSVVPSPAFSVSPPPPPPQPLTLLTLSSGSLLFRHHHQIPSMSHVSSIAAAFHAVVPKDSDRDGKKIFPETDRRPGDRRRTRMIKNRESAARSRARKQESILISFLIFSFPVSLLQAYTNELELEVAHLLEENAKLRKQQEQICREAAAYDQKRRPLHPTSTARQP